MSQSRQLHLAIIAITLFAFLIGREFAPDNRGFFGCVDGHLELRNIMIDATRLVNDKGASILD